MPTRKCTLLTHTTDFIGRHPTFQKLFTAPPYMVARWRNGMGVMAPERPAGTMEHA